MSRTLPEARFVEGSAVSLPPGLAVSVVDPDRFTFAAVGDLHIAGGDTTRLGRILDAATAGGDAFVVLLGDIVDQGEPSDVAAVDSLVAAKGWTGKVVPVIGNHDVFHGGWDAWKASHGTSHFAFNVGNSRFVSLDTADGTLGETQAEWLERELKSQGPRHWFLLSHYSPVVPGVRTYLRFSDDAEALRLRALAHRRGVSAWIAAHYHSYVLGKVDGVDYLIAGGGGGRRMPPVQNFFFARVTVDGAEVRYGMIPVE